ncbi:PLP-dependent aminotransferase family protein [Dactylosporangium sp. AC04546]|uniref:aminotransferase-like domain-containing protein n=1 Tax=Dactylosporangium sp. AC04546 TaxID=2862460 RepID=UPI001EDF7AA2|nr:PLP-dependent aminotransferase family protein [Dactylosporangium sp. AC04546]WVK78241.1 PLP-dependent aminotransferase family protein [Dactylosporangium sp. AC04546]
MPTIQYTGRPGVLDLSWGHPHPDALPVDGWAAATGAALRELGWRALTYGHEAGPVELAQWLCERLAVTDARAPVPAEVFVTAGASHALELLSTQLVEPGDVVLVDAPTYHLALRVLADRRAELVGVPPDPETFGETVTRLRRAGRRVALYYLVPTFGNPTGASLAGDRRRALPAVADRLGVTVVEDDTYRELAYDGPAPPSLWALSGGAGVVRIGSFAKSVAPGLRLGWLTGPPALVTALAGRGYVDSGGGVNHTAAVAMAAFGRSGAFARHVASAVERYRAQRDALVAALGAAGVLSPVPAGGWFVWLAAPGASALLPAAEAAGVSFVPGRRFFAGGGPDDHLRLSFSMLGPADLAEAAGRLAPLLRAASPPPS